MPLIYLSDIRLNAELTGPKGAPAVVLLHALGTDSGLWAGLRDCLPTNIQILTMDLRGHGASDVPAPPYAMGAMVRDVERVMDHFALRDTAVIGVSLGGLIAQGLAIKRLDLVRALVLSNTAAKIGTAELWNARCDEVARTGLEPYADGAMARMLGRGWRDHPKMPLLRQMLVRTAPQGWIGAARAIAGTDFYTPTASLRLPTLVIAGADDGTTPPDLVRETADLIPDADFHLMRGVGHLPMLDKPAEYGALISIFLDRLGHG
jgi:3-oxoadipate enol-lactonase